MWDPRRLTTLYAWAAFYFLNVPKHNLKMEK
jgi:hypothetical protein